MPIYEYKEGEHGGGFIGLRVAVTVNKERKQKYFSFLVNGFPVSHEEKQIIEDRAKQLEDKWKYQQNKVVEKRKNQANEHIPGSLYSTGVRGIKMKFLIKNKLRAGEIRNYYTPAFIVAGSNDKKKISRHFNIITHGYQNAWTNAVLYYAYNKNLTSPDTFINRLPPVEKFMIIIKDMQNSGHKVPKRRLPVELWNNNQVHEALVSIV